MGTQALLLDAIGRERPYVTIKSTLHPEGRHYELIMGDEMGPESLKQLETLGESSANMVARQEAGEKLDVADGQLLQDWTDTIMNRIFWTEIEPEVLKELTYPMKLSCLQTFTAVCWPSPTQPTQQSKKAKRQTGAK